jgi:hypothetical protein
MTWNPGRRRRCSGGVRAGLTGLPGEWCHSVAQLGSVHERHEPAAQEQRSHPVLKATHVDGLDGVDEVHEAEADRFAWEQLIPLAAALKLQGLRTVQKLKAAATALGIAAGIVVGRMQHDGWVPRTHLNGLKVSYHWPWEESDD